MASTLITLVSFNGATGEGPEGSLITDAAGDLFGTTEADGAGGDGTLFEIVKSGSGYATPTVLVSFNGTDGESPLGSLITDAAGDLFGTTDAGGASYDGTVFEIVKSGSGYASTPTVLVSFNATNGESPRGSLIADAAGDLFGTTYPGGANSDGTVFEIVKSGSGYASTPTVLVSFNGANGGSPVGSLITDAAGDLFGTTYGGGAKSDGTVFEIAKSGSGYASTPTLLVSFNGTNGQHPEGSLITDAAGDLFGTTEAGGASLDGTVFEIVKSGSGYASTPTVLVSFNGTDGEHPEGSLITDAAGDLFGTTEAGGASGDGTLFEIAKSASGYASTPTVLASFNSANGKSPVGSLITDAAGDLFGTTELGGANSDGNVFELTSGTFVTTAITGTIANQATTLEAPVDPFANVTVSDTDAAATDTLTIVLSGAGGTLSGTGLGGSNGSYTLTGTAAVITADLDNLSFMATAGAPASQSTTDFALTNASGDGSTSATDNTTSVTDTDPAVAPTITGTHVSTTTFEAAVTPFSGVTVTDTNANATDVLTITQTGTGTLSGMGLLGSNGTYTLSGTAAVITSELDALSFQPVDGVRNSSVTTNFTLSDTSGAFATAATDATTSVTDIDASTLITLVSFNGTNGAYPEGSLITDAAGDLFGTTENGGASSAGTVFEIAKSGSGYASTPTVLVSFNGTDGNGPFGSLITDAAGDLFGTTEYGGASSAGTVFEIAKSGSGYASTPTVLVSFNDTDGNGPFGSLITDAAGDLFGTTEYGGAGGGGGTVFEIAKSGSGYASAPTVLVSFNYTNGLNPEGSLITDAAGDLFGTTDAGGASNEGTVFEIVKSGSGYASTPTVLVSFNRTDGGYPEGSLITDAAGDLFGTTYLGGASGGYGTVFEIAKSGSGYATTPTVLVSFNGKDGQNPEGSLITDAAGDLFGTTIYGGANGDGSLFEIVKSGSGYASTPTVLVSFNSANGKYLDGSLITDAAGDLFGTTEAGGANSDGSVFEFTSGTFVTTAITGTIANQATTLEAPVNPFANVTVSDTDAAATDTLTIVLSGAGGTLSGTGLGGSNGTYTLTGTAAVITADLDSLSFMATAGAPASQSTTDFALTNASGDGSTSATDNTTSVTDTDPAVAPVISNVPATTITTASEKTVDPFASVTVSDANNSGGNTDTLTITQTGAGALSYNGVALTKSAAGTYTLTGAASAITSELDQLVFTPVDGVANTSVSTSFTLSDSDPTAGTVSTTSAAITVTDSDAPVAPVISNVPATTITTASEKTVDPFASVTVSDANNSGGNTDTLTITQTGAGALSYNGVALTKSAAGIYTLTGTAMAITSELDQLVFTPVDGVANTSVSTSFTLSDGDPNAGTVSTTSAAITVTDTDPAVAPVISNVPATTIATASEKTVDPFASVKVADANNSGGNTDTLTITQTGAGALSYNGAALTKSAAGTYTLTGAASAITSELDQLVFTPVDGVANTSGSTSFTLSDSDPTAGTVSTTSAAITVTDSDAPVAPVILGTHAATIVNFVYSPFGGVTIGDPNAGTTDTLTITQSGGGSLFDTTYSGLLSAKVAGSQTIYTISGGATTVTSVLDGLLFIPGYTPNTSLTTSFALSDTAFAGTNALTTSVTDTATKVTIVDPAVAPVISGLSSQTVTNAMFGPFIGVTVGDANANSTDTLTINQTGPGLLYTYQSSLASQLHSTQTATGFTYTISGSAATVTNVLDDLMFLPGYTPNTASATSFTLTDTTSAGPSVTAAMSITEIDPAVAPVITGTKAGQIAGISNAAIKPFSTVVIADSNSGTTDTAYILIEGAGTLSGTGLSAPSYQAGQGNLYSVSAASLASLNADVENLVYTPVASPTHSVQTITFGFVDGTSAGTTAADSATTLTIDPGPTVGSISSSLKLGAAVDLTSAVLAASTPGLKGDKLTITADSSTGTLGTLSLVNGDLVYSATGTGLSHIPANGSVTDSFTYTISDQYGDTATATAKVTVTNPATVINGSIFGFSTIQGTASADIITAYGFFNTIYDNGGNDIVNAGLGNATVYNSSGNVVTNLQGFYNNVSGGNGNDTVSGSQGNTSVTLGNGMDSVTTGGFFNTINLGSGNDTVSAGQGNALVTLGAGTDSVTLGGFGNSVTAGNGNDSVKGGQGLDVISLGNGNDSVSDAGYSDKIAVGSGTNAISGGSGLETIVAGAGTDTITLGGTGNNVTLNGSTATVAGGQGSDTMTVNGGKDTLAFAGYFDQANLNGVTAASIYDLGNALRINIGSSTQTDTVSGFGSSDTSGVVDLQNGTGGYTSVSQIVAALHSDGHGGTMLALGTTGSIDFVNTAASQLHASNFKIG